MKRREVLTRLAAGAAGVMAGPAAKAIGQTPGPPDQATSAQAQATSASLPRLLDDHRLAMLAGLADQILPGSRAAGVPALLDRVLAVEPFEAQRRFLNAVGAFEREARDRHGRGWMEITESEQVEILRAASTLASARPAPPPWTSGQPVDRPSPSPEAPASFRDHFDHLKDLVQRAYATTEAGAKDLGFAGRMAFPAFPGCPHAGTNHS